MSSSDVAIVGAGIAGIACARRLRAAGRVARLFEGSRAAGGRMATRRFESVSFDHGAQYFTVRDGGFRRVVDEAAAEGAAAAWRPLWPGGEDAPILVGTPGMSALPRQLARELDVEVGARIARLERERGVWTLVDDRGGRHPDFGCVVLAIPAPGAAALAAPHTALAERVVAVPMAPCWAVLAAFERPVEGLPDAEFSGDEILPWFARNSSKPGRPAPDAWVLHASAAFSRRELDTPPVEVQRRLIERFRERAGGNLPPLLLSDSHRWRHARVERPLGEPWLLDGDARLGFCGDWCIDARVEAAWLSGDGLGAALAVNGA